MGREGTSSGRRWGGAVGGGGEGRQEEEVGAAGTSHSPFSASHTPGRLGQAGRAVSDHTTLVYMLFT